MDVGREKRESARSLVDLSVACRVPATPIRAELSDISRTGCKASMTVPGAVGPGSTILLHLMDDIEVAGQILWTAGDTFGVRFFEPLEDAALARLCENELQFR